MWWWSDNNRVPMVIVMALLMHVIQGIVLLATRAADQTTGMASLVMVPIHGFALGLWLIATALCAATALVVGPGRIISLVLLLPEQIMLTIGALGRIRYITAGHFADGVVRPWEFIFVDQVGQVIFAVGFIFVALRYSMGLRAWM